MASLKIVYLFQYCPRGWDLCTYGAVALAERGFDVEAWDVSALLFGDGGGTPGAPPDSNAVIRIRRPVSYNELRLWLTDQPGKLLFVDHVAHINGIGPKNARLFRMIGESGFAYAIIYVGGHPGVEVRRTLKLCSARSFTNLVRKVRLRVIYDKVGRLLISRMARYSFGYRRPVRVYSTNRNSPVREYLKAYGLSSAGAVLIPAYDYEIYRTYRMRARSHTNSGICVYLEDGLTGHPDFARNGIKSLERGPFLSSLNRVFDCIEKKASWEVVIAAHPRSHGVWRSSDFGGRTVVNSKTVEFAAEAELVVAHYSTAVSFAVLGRRPLLFLKTREMIGTSHERATNRLASALGAVCLNADDAGDFEAIDPRGLKPDLDAYERFVNEYIKPPGVPDVSMWDIICEDIRKLVDT